MARGHKVTVVIVTSHHHVFYHAANEKRIEENSGTMKKP